MCDFLVQGHKSAYSKNYDDAILIGRPFFERFYTVFNYTEGEMTLKVGTRSMNDYKYEPIDQFSD